MDERPEEEALKNVMGLAEAALSGMMKTMKPMLAQRIRTVLESNFTLVDQSESALDHLANAIADELFRLP